MEQSILGNKIQRYYETLKNIYYKCFSVSVLNKNINLFI